MIITNGIDEMSDKIDESLANILDYICKNPLIFVSETDIHALVMADLMKIPELTPKRLYPTNCTIGINKFGKISKINYKTMRIHKEYGHSDKPNARSDIVILNPKDIQKIKDPLNLKDNQNKPKWITPDYIFEFGTEKCASSAKSFKNHLENDISKVSKSNKKGYIIHIQRIFCKTKTDSEIFEKNRNKYYNDYLNVLKEKSEKIDKVCKKLNIQILAIMIDIGNEGRRISKEGKIKIFNGQEFVGVNQSKIKEEIKKILKQKKYPHI